LTTDIARPSGVSLTKLSVFPAAIWLMISSQYSSAPRLRLPLLMRLRMMSISAAPGFTTSGESSYIVRYCSLQTISRPLISNKTTPCVMLFKVSANNLASGLRAWRPIKRLRAPNMVPRASKLPPSIVAIGHRFTLR
jgi:hypothetical protein